MEKSSCDSEIDLSFYANNGGNIYMAGYVANFNSDGIIQTTSEYDIICSGILSCHRGKTFQNAKNLYCTGQQSSTSTFDDIVIVDIGNVYFYGYLSGESATIYNILDSIYCNANQACYRTKITNVENNVYGGGNQVLYNSEITNTTNVCKTVFSC